MNLKKTLFIITLFLSSISFAQKDLIGASVSYSNQSGNFGKAGLFIVTGFNSNSILYKIDANVNMAYMRDNFHVIPEIGITGYLAGGGFYYIFPFVESEFTPYTITPKVGISVGTFVDFGIGFGFKINEKEDFKPIKGFQFSVGLNIPFNVK